MLSAYEDVTLEIVHPKHFDNFSFVMYWWYREAAHYEDIIPNLMSPLVDENNYALSFFDNFAASIYETRKDLGVDMGYEEDYMLDIIMEELMECFDHYLPRLTKDMRTVLNDKNMFYSIEDQVHVNAPLRSVW